ncbi:uncharacterized protein LOC123513823 isoform X2 [Portunus trituberculatus]|uniref:uncharacterized protein LOC123513823 isoform X2 n=1 Tax=Portunus trituberculatus TaxID=210409 RepID=UPI001E1CD343|nr:uncharacterized protein LOC123513823 isoform X2 [Portunus trituberculatus]
MTLQPGPRVTSGHHSRNLPTSRRSDQDRCQVAGGEGAMAGPPPLLNAGVDVASTPPRFTNFLPSAPEPLLHYSFPSEADTLAYVDALKHSDLSDWRSLQEVAARAGAGSCSGAVTTSVLTALYLLGLFNLCVASPASCCVPPASGRRRRRSSVDATLPPLLNNLQYNLSSLSLEQFRALPHVTTPDGGRVPLHISVVEQVRKLWDSNPRLLSSVSCSSATESVRSSFISLSGVASGIILAYSVAQLNQCYPDHTPHPNNPPKIWFFPIPKAATQPRFPVPMIPMDIPVSGDDEEEDGCPRDEVPLGMDRCAPLLSSNPCPYRHWVLLNSDTRTGECVPRLCADNYVYVETDQLCHDVNEPGICPGNRRLYLTAYGTAVCDCPEGMFPGPNDSCYFLYEKAYCNRGFVLQFDRNSKTLTCRPDPCSHVNSQLWPNDLPYAPRPKDGFCYQFNEQGPCKAGQRFGYDTDKLEATCVSLMEAGLARPRRSFQYQQMSFPATQDRQYHHYQVSYIIMNGTTWDLEVKGIKRTKRDVAEPQQGTPHLSSGHLVVPFIDTRSFPRNVHPSQRPRSLRWASRRHTWRGNNHPRRVHAIRHQRGAARTLAMEGQASHHVRRKVFNRARLKSRRMNSGPLRQSRETTFDSEFHRDFRSIVKINHPPAALPVVVPQTPALPAAARPVRKVNLRSGGRAARQNSRRRKSKKRGKGRRKKKGRKRRKKKKGRRRGHRRRQRLGGSRNSTRTKGKRKRKHPRLPFRVPTVIPPLAVNATSGGARGVGGTNSSDADGEEEEAEDLSSSEMSLPKYLRHRGRRQLGEGGGIIQAPLLSACKPGAKRDYNYKCRPKFIPQGRDRRRVGGVSVGPRRPTISCPKGTRLDPRGKCQQIG